MGASRPVQPGCRRLHKRLEQRVRPVGAALELGMELRPDHERVFAQLGDLHQPTVGRKAGKHQPIPDQHLAVGVVELEAMAMPLVGVRRAIRGLRARVGVG